MSRRNNVGDIRSTVYSKIPLVVLRNEGADNWVCGFLRDRPPGHRWSREPVRAGTVQNGFGDELPEFESELTDEEQALAFRLLLIGE